jgi:hypothetical protein
VSICCGLALGLAAMALSAPRVHAQASTASQRALARQQFQDGVAAARAGEWDAAFEAFQSSYALVPRPITLLNLAGAMVQTGRLVEGAEAYRRFLREADSSAERHREAAERALAELEGRLPAVRVRVLGFEEGDVLTLDGWEVSQAVLDEELPVDPGEHEIVVTRAGHDPLRLEFAAREGASREVVVDARPESWPRTGERGGTRAPRTGSGDDVLGPTDLAPRDEGGGVLSSPVFWVITAVILVGAGVLTGVLIATSDQGRDPVSGNLPPFRVEVP